jgi:NDP-sugar pyrophosphorylase family protein
MKAMILSAGLGTRLRPLTYETPKPLIPVAGRPIITYVIEFLKKYEVRDLVINLYHLPQLIEDYLGDGSLLGVKITYSHEKELLGTAGAILEVRDLLSDGPFLVINSDILIDLDLGKFVRFHQEGGSAATLAVKASPDAEAFGALGVDKQGRIVKFLDLEISKAVRKGVFTGVSILEPMVFGYISHGGDGLGDKVFPAMLRAGERLVAYEDVKYWQDIGTPERLSQAEQDLREGRISWLRELDSE